LKELSDNKRHCDADFALPFYSPVYDLLLLQILHLFMPFISSPGDLITSPKRIISLVPSQTELLHDLGLEEEVVGITKFCIHPESWFRSKMRVGGTKQLNLETIRSLKPDLVIANKEENVKEQVEELANEFPVWVSDINNLDEAIGMINTIGVLTHKQAEAEKISTEIKTNFDNLSINNPCKWKACYLIWKDPYMTIGDDTFIHDMLLRAGFENSFASQKRYPEIDLDDLKNTDCELVLLSSEPYPFKEKHIEEIKKLLPHINVILVDGEMFSWYGSRLLQAPAYFNTLRKSLEL
jgi:ABC-type Fe3+-hydroxamate transport system substrate-binding protein